MTTSCSKKKKKKKRTGLWSASRFETFFCVGPDADHSKYKWWLKLFKNMQTFEVAVDKVVKGEGLCLSRKASTDLTFLTESGEQVVYVVSASCRHIKSRARLKRWGR
jgi:hypothetical protein